MLSSDRLARRRVDTPDFRYPLGCARRRPAGVHPHDLVGVLAESTQKKEQRKGQDRGQAPDHVALADRASAGQIAQSSLRADPPAFPTSELNEITDALCSEGTI